MWFDKLIIAIFVFAIPWLVIFSCERPRNIVPPYVPGTYVVPSETGRTVQKDPCRLACEKLTELGCEGGADSTGGADCYEVCFHVENSGVARFCPVEISKITSCAEAESAFRSCDKQKP